jgi:enterochelin esterase-like enzyme
VGDDEPRQHHLDSLIAEGKAKPMIVVMPNGNAAQTVSRGYAF